MESQIIPKKCKITEDLNPFTNKCVIKCAEGKRRYIDLVNKKFSCLDPLKNKDKFPEVIDPVPEVIDPVPEVIVPAANFPVAMMGTITESTNILPVAPAPAPAVPAAEENIQLLISDTEEDEKKQKKRLNEINMLKETKEREDIINHEDAHDYLYPNLNDPLFNIKISEKKEFNDTKYNGEIVDVEKQAELLCNAEFELAPQQMFVRNFLSFQTPYNSLLLYHGLGSGKTCSAISVAEEMRDYLIQMNIDNKIMVIASPNVQENFRLQLFDERKLKLVDGLWNIRACTGNKFLKEINPMNMKGLSRDNVVNQVKKIINTYYIFLGYIEFANYVHKHSILDSSITDTKQKKIAIRQKLRRQFSNRLVIIDEVHNIRIADDNSDKKRVAMELFKLVENVDNLRFLLLSATPMYNSYKEIIWLVNLMNINDRRPTIEIKDVFNTDGTFKTSETGEEIGRELLERKATGYISFVRGENPYTFPYRIWPTEFAIDHTFANEEQNPYPVQQLNGKEIIQHLEILAVYLVETGAYQQLGYNYIINKLKTGSISGSGKEMPSFDNMESFGYTLLQRPLEALNMIYPHPKLVDADTAGVSTAGVSADTAGVSTTGVTAVKIGVDELVGKVGLSRMMSYEETGSPPSRFNFDYKDPEFPIFKPNEIGKYSGKIKNICDRVINSTGVILIYSQYIDGGVLPIALALEELGFTRAGTTKSLLKDPPAKIDALTYKTKAQSTNAVVPTNEVLDPTNANESRPQAELLQFHPATYVMITGDKALSPDNVADIALSTNVDNKDGSRVKVIFISQAGAEGLDLKFIRQVHILEPWYNMNRIEQIIGRAVRTCSHKDLPFNKRNVEIYLYGSLMENKREEAADLYVYRLAELKAVQIGNVSRVLKEISVDCILNYEQIGLIAENMKQNVKLELSSGGTLSYDVGDKPYSSTCDYMNKCQFVCKPNKEIKDEDVKLDTYNEQFILMNTDKIIHKIRSLMKERFFYKKTDLIKFINAIKKYPLVQINAALEQLIDDKNEFITDKYNRVGNLINIGDMYLFQPLELNNKNISIYDRSVPIDFKHDKLSFIIPEKIKKSVKLGKLVVSEDTGADRADTGADRAAADRADTGEADTGEADTGAADRADRADTGAAEAPAPQKDTTEFMELLNNMNTNYDMAINKQVIIRGEDNWYKFCSLVISDLESDLTATRDDLLDILIAHIIDELNFEHILLLLNNLETIPSTEFGTRVKNYINSNIITNKGVIGMLVNNNGKHQLLKKSMDDNTWKIADAEDYHDLTPQLNTTVMKFIPVEDKLSKLVGFMDNFKKDYIIFKVKDLTKPRHKGARCDQSGKREAIKMLNAIIGEEKYNDDSKISQKQVCVLQEFMLRIYNKEKKNGVSWFLSPAEAALINIEKLSVNMKN
jgi:hypothetical protein